MEDSCTNAGSIDVKFSAVGKQTNNHIYIRRIT